jgi:hypothetical protein
LKNAEDLNYTAPPYVEGDWEWELFWAGQALGLLCQLEITCYRVRACRAGYRWCRYNWNSSAV